MDLFNSDNHVAILEKFLEKQPKKVLIFDFDQTLCHLHLPWHRLVEPLQAYLRQKDTELYQTTKPGNPTSKVIDAFVKKYGDEVWQYERSASAEFEKKELTAAPCNHQLLDWIAAHKDSYLMYVWSSNVSGTIQTILEKENYAGIFQLLVGKDTVQLTKPNPDGFAVIFMDAKKKHAGLEKQDFLMVGNNPLDDKGAARNAGIDFVRVQYSEVM